ncbi:MAG TPA: glycyl-radical enzyme activating protein [Thermoanaerobacterales bacterium]|jgi:pyruvate formate lyase activating enzyme|nr:glycyl-radical enzyme activating protein [Thermoanaerobacterales bacterium]
MSVKGIVFDIKRFAIHDGPGIRTTVFLKGCPLKCWWCHNPEGNSVKQDLMFFEFKCMKCKTCVNVCPLNAITFQNDNQVIDRKICDYCGKCAKACPTEALKLIGYEMTVDELVKEIEKDVLLYDNSGGGVTFSGGEPLLQHQFLKEALKECQRRDIHTVLDTSGYATKDVFSSVADYVDLFLYDLKLADDEEHLKYTGVSNRSIKDNLQMLLDMGRGNDVILRFPVITGITDTEENVNGLVEFVSSLKGLNEIDLLPFHDVSEKFKRLDAEYKMTVQKAPTKQKLKAIKEKFEAIGLYVKI